MIVSSWGLPSEERNCAGPTKPSPTRDSVLRLKTQLVSGFVPFGLFVSEVMDVLFDLSLLPN